MIPPSDLAAINIALPRLKVFPLPSAVLLPGSIVPLHIFEPRYRALVTDALNSDRVLALAMMQSGREGDGPSDPALRPLCGAGIIDHHERLADGRFNILLRGVARVAIRAEHPRRSLYREVRAELVAESNARRANLLESLKQFLLAIAPRLPEAEAGAVLRAAARATTPGELADGAAALLVSDPQGRQAVLETLEVDRRVDGLIAAASAALARAGSPDALKH